MHSRLATKDDITNMLDLQKANLYSELSETERENGFVTTPFTIAQIEKIVNQNGLFVTIQNEKLIAYAFAGTWEYFEQWPIFPFMTSRFPSLSFDGKKISVANTFQYGPICIDISHRGVGVMNHVFEAMRLEWVKKYPISVTFINRVNTISSRAHEKLGWKIIDEFEFNNNGYFGLAFDMNRTVKN